MIFINVCLCLWLTFLQGGHSAPNGGEIVTNIIGGFFAKPDQFPYQVSIRNPDGEHFCAGSILNDSTILTAGHCCEGIVDIGNSYVTAGSTELSDSKNVRVSLEYYEILQFYHGTYQNDICLIGLSEQLKFTESIKPIELQDGEVKPGTECTISGWGLWAKDDIQPKNDSLKFANVPIVEDEVCQKAYPDGFVNVKTMICAGLKEGGTDTCQGDSGGPLVCDGKLTGIAIMGSCAEPGYPSIYTRVVSYLDWLNNHDSFWEFDKDFILKKSTRISSRV